MLLAHVLEGESGGKHSLFSTMLVSWSVQLTWLYCITSQFWSLVTALGDEFLQEGWGAWFEREVVAYMLHCCPGSGCRGEAKSLFAKVTANQLKEPTSLKATAEFLYVQWSPFSQQECVSCCEGMICNVEIPTNHTNAVFAVLHARRTSDGNRRTVNIALLVSAVMIALSWCSILLLHLLERVDLSGG